MDDNIIKISILLRKDYRFNISPVAKTVGVDKNFIR